MAASSPNSITRCATAKALHRLLWIYEDVTRDARRPISWCILAERDALTGLYNRTASSRSWRAPCWKRPHQMRCAVMFFDLDEFKTINDSYGHSAGDALLIRVAEKSARWCGATSAGTAGGDEFAILLPGVQGKEAEALANAWCARSRRFRSASRAKSAVTTSLGIAYYPTHAADADDLVARPTSPCTSQGCRQEYLARFRATTRPTPRCARLSWGERISNRSTIAVPIAFSRGCTGRRTAPCRTEALIRMIDASKPDQLIMRRISSRWPKRAAASLHRPGDREALRMLAENPATPPSRSTCRGVRCRAQLPQYIGDELREAGVDPARLIVEITETAAVSTCTMRSA